MVNARPSSLTTIRSLADYIIYKDGSTYYAINAQTGSTAVSPNSNFTTLMNSMFTAATAGDRIFIEKGNYVVPTTISGKSGVRLYGDGRATVFDCSTMSAYDYAMEWFGTLGTSTAVATSVAQGDTHIHVASSSGYTADDILFLTSTDQWKTSNPTGTLKGELHYAGTIESGIVNLRTGASVHPALAYTFDSYTNTTSTLQKVTPMSNVIIDGITFIGDESLQLEAIYVTYGDNFTINNCFFQLMEGEAVQYQSCMNSRVINSYFANNDRIETDGEGYGVGLSQAVQNIDISGNHFIACRHAVAGGAGTYAGVPRGVHVHGNTARDCGVTVGGGPVGSFNWHNVGENINFTDNIIQGGGYGFDAYQYSGLIANNTVYGAVGGVEFDCTAGDGVLVEGNLFQNCWSNAIVSNTANTRKDVISNNHFINNGYISAVPVIAMAARSTGLVIMGNKFEDSATFAIALNNCSGAVIKDNFFRGSGKFNGNHGHITLYTTAGGNLITNNVFRQGSNSSKPESCVAIGSGCVTNIIRYNDMQSGTSTYISDSGTTTVKDHNYAYPTGAVI